MFLACSNDRPRLVQNGLPGGCYPQCVEASVILTPDSANPTKRHESVRDRNDRGRIETGRPGELDLAQSGVEADQNECTVLSGGKLEMFEIGDEGPIQVAVSPPELISDQVGQRPVIDREIRGLSWGGNGPAHGGGLRVRL